MLIQAHTNTNTTTKRSMLMIFSLAGQSRTDPLLGGSRKFGAGKARWVDDRVKRRSSADGAPKKVK